jgi:uncharacterized membrane protein
MSEHLKVEEVKDAQQLATMRHSKNFNKMQADNLSFGDKLADRMADLAGSWTFIIIFILILCSWIVLNSAQVLWHPFDPYPYILLNLVLSCISGIQAPVIMMSQNRQEEKDRIRAEHDYEIDFKAEILLEDVINRLARLEENQQILMAEQKVALGKLTKSTKQINS